MAVFINKYFDKQQPSEEKNINQQNQQTEGKPTKMWYYHYIFCNVCKSKTILMLSRMHNEDTLKEFWACKCGNQNFKILRVEIKERKI